MIPQALQKGILPGFIFYKESHDFC